MRRVSLFFSSMLALVGVGCGSTQDPPNLFDDGGGPDASVEGGGETCAPGACGGVCPNACEGGPSNSSCSDMKKNGDESDVDCGGSCPKKCAQGSACNAGGDCSTGHCEANLCDVASCADGSKDGDETDLDCGGSCLKCPPGKACAAGTDCTSGVCTNKSCQAPTCSDGMKNGAETDTDCGGTCPKCANSKICKVVGDCTSNLCFDDVCVECIKGTDCPNRLCSNNACITASTTPPSCAGLGATCGPSGNGDCCASDTVTGTASGAPFNRSNAAASPATIATFRLDRYEVTVGRFRKFIANYSQPAGGDGANPNDPSDVGWDPAWTTGNLAPATAAALTASFATSCPAQATWTDAVGANETKPIECLTWYMAYAFCIWDQGRLPTEAEWNYAAAGGAAPTGQRQFPWVDTTPLSASVAWYGQNGYNNVGLLPGGAARFGQLDMAGNVWEWTLDYYDATYPTPCANCANFTQSATRTLRGGIQNPGSEDPNVVLRTTNRGSFDPAGQAFDDGVRCARK